MFPVYTDMFLVSAMMFLVLHLHLPVSGFAYAFPVYANMFLVSAMMFLVATEMFFVSADILKMLSCLC